MPAFDPLPWLTLALAKGVGPMRARLMIDAAGGAAAARVMPLAQLKTLDGVGTVGAEQIFAGLRQARLDAPAVLDRADRLGQQILGWDHPAYPVPLREIPDPPVALFVRGELRRRDLNAVGIVGSRKCSHYGREQANRFGGLLAGAGFTAVSGGARGIDTAAHLGALAHPDGRTVAVLGCAADVAYPPENAPLFARIADGRGAVVSEHPPGTPPLADFFPRRNRIISGLSRGVLVVEADDRSGALITARQAGEDQGRTVFALPGRVDSPTSRGTHKLLRDGAVLVRDLDDILEDLTPLPDAAYEAVEDGEPSINAKPPPRLAAPLAGRVGSVDAPGRAPQAGRLNGELFQESDASIPTLTADQRRVLGALDRAGCSVDAIIDATDLPAQVVMSSLTLMSLKGLVKRVDGQTYARK